MKLQHVILQYTNEILISQDKEKTTLDIISKIADLTYSESGQKITDSDEKKIIDGIYNLLIEKRNQKTQGKLRILNEKDNINYLTLLQTTSKALSKKQSGGEK